MRKVLGVGDHSQGKESVLNTFGLSGYDDWRSPDLGLEVVFLGGGCF